MPVVVRRPSSSLQPLGGDPGPDLQAGPGGRLRRPSIVSDLMGLEYASQHLADALLALATGEDRLGPRLQRVWDDHVQHLWERPCLTRELLAEFRDLWHRYTAPSDDRRSTRLRELNTDEVRQAIGELVSLSQRTAATGATQAGSEALATMADLS